MAKRKRLIPDYSTVTLNGVEYYRTRIEDADGKRVALYARTPEELYGKETEALEQAAAAAVQASRRFETGPKSDRFSRPLFSLLLSVGRISSKAKPAATAGISGGTGTIKI